MPATDKGGCGKFLKRQALRPARLRIYAKIKLPRRECKANRRFAAARGSASDSTGTTGRPAKCLHGNARTNSGAATRRTRQAARVINYPLRESMHGEDAERRSYAACGQQSKNMSEEKMQACPFCGWLETPSEKAEHIIVDGAHCLQCRRCKAVGPQTFDENGGVAAWNKRAGGRQSATG